MIGLRTNLEELLFRCLPIKWSEDINQNKSYSIDLMKYIHFPLEIRTIGYPVIVQKKYPQMDNNDITPYF